MVFDTRVLLEPTAKQQELTLQGVAQMVMNMKSQPRPSALSRSASGRVLPLLQVLKQKKKKNKKEREKRYDLNTTVSFMKDVSFKNDFTCIKLLPKAG